VSSFRLFWAAKSQLWPDTCPWTAGGPASDEGAGRSVSGCNLSSPPPNTQTPRPLHSRARRPALPLEEHFWSGGILNELRVPPGAPRGLLTATQGAQPYPTVAGEQPPFLLHFLTAPSVEVRCDACDQESSAPAAATRVVRKVHGARRWSSDLRGVPSLPPASSGPSPLGQLHKQDRSQRRQRRDRERWIQHKEPAGLVGPMDRGP